MTEIEKARIISLWKSGLTLGQIRSMTPMTPRAFDLSVRTMKRNGEFPKNRKTCAEKIVEAYERGERNPYDIAEEYGVAISYVYRVLSNHRLSLGKKTRNFVHTDRTHAIVEDLQNGELSQVEIAKKHGVTRQYIGKVKVKLEKGILDNATS